MRIHIEPLAYKAIRNRQVGDWQFRNGDLYIQVAAELTDAEQACIGLHEMVEALLCRAAGVEEAAVSEWDKSFEAARSPAVKMEAGDHPHAPYHPQHTFASELERRFHAALCWQLYDTRINSL